MQSDAAGILYESDTHYVETGHPDESGQVASSQQKKISIIPKSILPKQGNDPTGNDY